MTALNDYSRTTATPVAEGLRGRTLDRPMCDGLPREAAGPRFRFTDCNPLNGSSYAQSVWSDLPYLIWVLVRDELRLTDAE